MRQLTSKLVRGVWVLCGLSVLVPWSAYGHLGQYEPERLRNDNHFTTGGFAQPQIGECVPSELDPAGLYCSYRVQDDWSFDNPLMVIESTKVPSPGLRNVPGFDIACTPTANFADGTNPACALLPSGFGKCVPQGPAIGTCDLAPGAARPRAGLILNSTLVGRDDVDVAVYKYEPRFGEILFTGSGNVPACKENIDVFPVIAWAGPLGLTDARTGEPLFQPLSEYRNLPDEVRSGLPEGYGIRVTAKPRDYTPTGNDPRPGYYSGHGQNAWLYNPGTQIVPCSEDPEICMHDPTTTHFDNNDHFYFRGTEKVQLFAIWWLDRQDHGDEARELFDVAMSFGTTDFYTPGDYAALGPAAQSVGNGRAIHGRCTDPRTTGKVNIHIE